eukprot:gene7846-5667_t
MFTEFDTNKDDHLDAQEFAVAAKKMHERVRSSQRSSQGGQSQGQNQGEQGSGVDQNQDHCASVAEPTLACVCVDPKVDCTAAGLTLAGATFLVTQLPPCQPPVVKDPNWTAADFCDPADIKKKFAEFDMNKDDHLDAQEFA